MRQEAYSARMKNLQKTRQKIGNFLVIFDPAEEGGYIVHVPMLPGCHTQGDTFEEAQQNAKEAIEAYLLALKDLHEDMPIARGDSIVSTVSLALPG